MASASKLEMVCRTLRGVLLSEKGGVAIHRLQGDFRELTGTPLQFKEFGYPSLEAFLQSIPHVVSLQRGPDGDVLCKCVTDDTTQHIGSLVSRQKGKKKSKGSGMKTHPGKPRGSPYRPKPFYGNYNPSRKPQPVTPKFRTKKPNPKFYKLATQQPRFHIPRPAVPSQSAPPKPTPQKTVPVNHYQSRTKTESTKSLASTYRSSANASATAVQQPTGTWSKTAPVNNRQSTTQTETTKRLGSASTSSANASATAVQQPTPGPWSGKLGSRRNQQSASSNLVDAKRNQPKPDPPTTQPTTNKPKVYENIYITVENDGATKGKAKSAKPNKVERSASLESAKAKKPEWSPNYEVPPRFKKLMSPTGTSFPDHQVAGPDRTQDTTSDPPVKARPPQVTSSTPPIRGKTSDWIQKVLVEKANGIWASGLSDMHKKEFGSSLDATIIDQMAEQNLLQKEMVLNNIILYPKLTVSIKNSSESKVSKRTVNLGAGDQKEVGTAAEKTGNQTAQSCPEAKPNITPALTKLTPPKNLFQDPALADPSLADILQAVCQRQNLPLMYKTEPETLLGKPYLAVNCTAGLQVSMAHGITQKAAVEAASANILYQWNIMPGDVSQVSQPTAGREELYLRVEHQAGFCDCSAAERHDDCKVPRCMASLLKRIRWKSSDDQFIQQNRRVTPTAGVPRRITNLSQVDRLEARAARFGLNPKAALEEVDSQQPKPLMNLSFSQGRAERFCVVNSKTLLQPRETIQGAQVLEAEDNSNKASSTGEFHVQPNAAAQKDAGIFPDLQEVKPLSQEEILNKRAERFGLTLNEYTHPQPVVGKTDNNPQSLAGITSNSVTTLRRAPDLEIRRVLRETFGRTAIYETVKETISMERPLVSVCFIAGSVVGIGKGPTKSEARKAALKELLLNQRQLKSKLKSASHKKLNQEELPNTQDQDSEPVARSHRYPEVPQDENLNNSGIQNYESSSSRNEANDQQQGKGSPKELPPCPGSEEVCRERKGWPMKPDLDLQFRNIDNNKMLNVEKRRTSPRGEYQLLQDASSGTAFPDKMGKDSCSLGISRWQQSPDSWTGSLRNGTPTGPSTSVVQPINNARWKPSDDWVVQQNPRLTPTADAPPTNNGTPATSPTNIVPSNLSSPRTVSPGAQLLGNPTLGNASSPGDPLPRNGSPQDPAQAESDASNINEITNSLANAQLSGTHSPPCVPVEETCSEPSEPSEGGGSPTMEVSGVPNLQLPEEDEWDVYVAYIKSLSDFFVILIGDDYSEQLMVLEEEMRLFYQCSTWTLTDPPEEGDCCAAQFNREWLRVMVKSVQGDQVECFLLDHGDIETVDISFLKPLSDTFLQLPFQVVRCKLAGSEQVAKDDDTALQMFCQLALGKNLLAEITSRDGDQVTMELFDESDVSILEQSMAAGI
ncbi:uncharacterized protein LOC119724583 [Patiria miniata]|uniref:Uncharacterized protein n=1 Tax=Patiria miniata TaxID=46514 RepID=A0A913ZJU9_PATMI|nr:uncharacterized protein LOC119724583 [Patiria miniata]